MEIKHSKSFKTYKKVESKLIESNYQKSKSESLNPSIYKHKIKIEGFYLFDGKKVVGGAGFYVDPYNWFYVDTMFVSEDYRGKDYGSKLIQSVVAYAKEIGCTGVKLDTWDFQAKPFYEKNGFTQYGFLEDYPKGHTTYLLAYKIK